MTHNPATPTKTLTRLTLVAVIGTALAYASEFLMLGFDLQIGVVVGCLVLAAALVASGWRGAPIVAAIVVLGIMMGNPYLQFNLSRPFPSAFFLAAFSQVLCSSVVLLAGLGATLLNYLPKRALAR